MLPFDPSVALDIVREAAQLALQLRGRFSAEVKADNTLVTEADRTLEEFLRERLGALAPGWSFLGEETGLSGDPHAPCWVIDPIDGTTNFVRDLPLWCISVGVVAGGEPIFGMVAVPPLGELYWAVKGQGAWRETPQGKTQLKVVDHDVLMQEDLIACNTTVERVVDFKQVPCRLRNFGSLAYHLTVMARGSLVSFIAHYHKLYDVAAGVCLCLEAGCVARYLDGRVWHADAGDILSTTPLLVAPPHVMDILLRALPLPDPRERPQNLTSEP